MAFFPYAVHSLLRAPSLRLPRFHHAFLVAGVALAIGWHLVALGSLRLGFLNPLFNDSTQRLGQGADFFSVYQAGRNFLHDQMVYQTVSIDRTVPYFYPFRYLPSAAYLVGLPLNLLHPWPAYWSWVVFNELLLAGNLWLTWRVAPSLALKLTGIVLWLFFTPFYLELYMGQFSFLMASLFFWLGLSLMRPNGFLAAATWTTSLLVKSNSLIFVPLWLSARRYSVAFSGLAIVCALNMPYFLLRSGSFKLWLGNFSALTGAPPPVHAGAVGLQNLFMLIRLIAADHATAPFAGLLLTVLRLPLLTPAILLLAAVASLCGGQKRALAVLCLWICTYFLVFSDVWEHHYVMLLPALVLLVLFQPDSRAVVLPVWLLLALPTPFLLFQALGSHPGAPAVLDPQSTWAGWQVLLYHLAKPLPVLVLWTYLAASLIREGMATSQAWPAGARLRTAAVFPGSDTGQRPDVALIPERAVAARGLEKPIDRTPLRSGGLRLPSNRNRSRRSPGSKSGAKE